MQYLGGKLSAAQLQVGGWVGSMRRSLQGALELVWGIAEDKQEEAEEAEKEEEEEEVGDGGGRFQRAMSPLRSFARRSRRSLRNLSIRSRQTLQRRSTETCSEQVKSYCTEGEGVDTEALIDGEPDQQYGSCKQTQSPESDSTKPVHDQGPEVSTDDLDAVPLHTEEELPAFPESSTPLLDNRAQRSRAELGKRRSQRTRLPRSARPSLTLPPQTKSPAPDWRACDSTDGKGLCAKQKESDSEEGQPRPKAVCSPPPTAQRVSLFPGLSASALMAQLKKRTGGGAEEIAVEKDSSSEEVAPSPSQLSRSTRSPSLLAGAARVLPPLGGTDGGPASSPSWLKELKSKKRLSQYDSET